MISSNLIALYIFSPSDEHETYLKQELIKRMLVCFPNDFQDDEPARNHCRDLIIECGNLALQVTNQDEWSNIN